MNLNQDNPLEILKNDNTAHYIITLITPAAQLFWDGHKFVEKIEGSNGFLDVKAVTRNVAVSEFKKAVAYVKANSDSYKEANVRLVGISPAK